MNKDEFRIVMWNEKEQKTTKERITMNKDECRIVIMGNDKEHFNLKEYQRTYFIDPKNQIYISPSLVGEDDMEAVILASFDAEGFIENNGHAYIATDVLSKCYPEKEFILNAFKTAVLDRIKKDYPSWFFYVNN